MGQTREASAQWAVRRRRKRLEFVGEQRVQMPLQGICATIANLTDRRETVGSSPTVTTKAEAVENQRLLLFYPLRGTRPQRYTPSMWTACSPNKATRSGWLRCRNRVGFIARIRVGLNAVVDVNGMSVPGQA